MRWGGGIHHCAKGLRIHIAQLPPEFVWCCLHDTPKRAGLTAGSTPARASSRKPWGMWPEKRGGLSEQLICKYLVVSGQSSFLMAILGFSYGAWAEIVLQTTLSSFSRTSSKFLCQLLHFLENSHSSLLRSGLWTLLSPKLRMPTLPLNLSSAEVAPRKFGKGKDLYHSSGPGRPSQKNIMALILPKCASWSSQKLFHVGHSKCFLKDIS